MNRAVAFVVLAVLIFGAAILSFFFPHAISETLFPLAVTLVGVLAGVLIASAGVFLGSVNQLHATINSNDRLPSRVRDNVQRLVWESASEIRRDTILVIIMAATLLIVTIINAVARELILAESTARILTMAVNTAAFGAVVVTFLSTIDTVLAMFRLNEHFRWIPPNDSRGSSES